MRKEIHMEDEVFIDFVALVSTNRVSASDFQKTIWCADRLRPFSTLS